MDRDNVTFAREFGINLRQVKRMGGGAKLRLMTPEARQLFFRSIAPPTGRSLAARGMEPKVPGIVRRGN